MVRTVKGDDLVNPLQSSSANGGSSVSSVSDGINASSANIL